MSSLYYQHRQHEQQQQQEQHQQAQFQREQQQQHQQHYSQYHQQQQQYQEERYRQSQSQSQSHQLSHSHSHEYHYQDPHPHSHLQEQQNPNPSPSYTSQIRNSVDGLANNGDQGRSSEQQLQQQPQFLEREEALDTLLAMMSQERSGYNLDSYFPRKVLPNRGNNGLPRQQNIIHGGWREKICQWSYNVVDHFDLPREIVSISLNYFDRYMATLSQAENMIKHNSKTGGRSSPQGSGDLALLASLGTLHLATKVHATNHNDYDPSLGPLEDQHHKVPSLSTLANLSRGQFGPESILEMEKLLLSALQWRLHPPTLYALVTFLLKLLPTTVEDPLYGLKPSIASELFEVAMYVAELSVCDAFFVERQIPASTIALAAICTSMDDLLAPEDPSIMAGVLAMNTNTSGSGCFTEHHRDVFLTTCLEKLGLGKNRNMFDESLERLRSMYLGASAMGSKGNNNADDVAPTDSQQQQLQSQNRSRTNSYNPPTSPSSIADMSLSTINSTIHSMADTTINGGGSSTLKRGDSMISSIACQSKETTLTYNTNHCTSNNIDIDDDELFGGQGDDCDDHHSHSQSNNSNNFRYSPSPPRVDVTTEAVVVSYDYEKSNCSNNPLMRCSPIVALL